ncbi:MAG: hypothetical protein ACE5DR_03035 [Thermodesulfobacteriota bacterium]
MKSTSMAEFVSRINIPRYINLLLLLAALLVAALIAREYLVTSAASLSGRGADGGNTAAAVKSPGKGQSSFADYRVIGRSGVFGVTTTLSLINRQPSQRMGRGPVAPASSAEAVLLGTVTGEALGGGDFAAVFKEKATGREEVVKRGEDVFNIGRLVSVSRYEAVVESGGRLLRFSMDLSEKERAMVNDSSLGRGSEGFSAGLEGLNSRGGFRAFGPKGIDPFSGKAATTLAKPLGKGKWLIDRRALEKAIEDSNSLISDARFFPYREGGAVKGFVLSQVRPYGVFYGLGIRSGDIVLRVNDYAIDAPEKAMSLMKGLKGETDVKVDFLRRGRAQTYTYEIR